MMRLPIASSAFAVLAMVCTIAFNAGAGEIFLWLAVFLIGVAMMLLGLWTWDLWWFYREQRKHPRDNDTEP